MPGVLAQAPDSTLSLQAARCPRRACSCTAPSPGNPSASVPPSRRRSSCAWSGPSRRTTTWWAPSASSWPAASASPRPRYRSPTPRLSVPSSVRPSTSGRRHGTNPVQALLVLAGNPAWKPWPNFAWAWGRVFFVAVFGCYCRPWAGFEAGNVSLMSCRSLERFSSVISCVLGEFSPGFKNSVKKGAAEGDPSSAAAETPLGWAPLVLYKHRGARKSGWVRRRAFISAATSGFSDKRFSNDESWEIVGRKGSGKGRNWGTGAKHLCACPSLVSWQAAAPERSGRRYIVTRDIQQLSPWRKFSPNSSRVLWPIFLIHLIFIL